MSDQIASKMASHREELYRAAGITEANAGRAVLNIAQDGSETLLLNGKPVLQFGPLSVEQEQTEDGWTLKVSRTVDRLR